MRRRLPLLFLALAAWGAIHPMAWFVAYMRQGNGLGEVIDAWYVNASTTGLVWDLTIAAVSLTLWVLLDPTTWRDRVRLVAIPATFCIGVSCGLPLYIYFATRKGGLDGGA